MSTNPAFASTPNISVGRLSAANTNRDGTGTLVDIFTAGAAGSKIERIIIQATATTTPGMVRLYTFDGTNNRLLAEVPVPAIVPSSTVQAFAAEIDCSKIEALILLKSGWKLKAAPHNAEGFDVTAIGGDY